jgi:hypothetical protein
MRTHTALIAAILFALSAGVVSAADLTGQWKAEFMTYYGQSPREVGETIFTFKHNGEELTGTVKGTALKETPIREGRVSGEKVSFVLIRNFGGRERKMTYTGTVEGDEIRFETSIEGFGRGVRMVAKKIS